MIDYFKILEQLDLSRSTCKNAKWHSHFEVIFVKLNLHLS